MQLGDKLEPEPFAESGVGLLPVWEQGFGAGMSAMGSWGAALEQLVPLPSLFPGRFLLAPGPGRGPDLSPGEGPLGVRGTSAGRKEAQGEHGGRAGLQGRAGAGSLTTAPQGGAGLGRRFSQSA